MESNKVKGLIFPVGGEAQAFLADRDRPYRDIREAVQGEYDELGATFADVDIYVNAAGADSLLPNRAINPDAFMDDSGFLSEKSLIVGTNDGKPFSLIFGNIVALSRDETGELIDMPADIETKLKESLSDPLDGYDLRFREAFGRYQNWDLSQAQAAEIAGLSQQAFCKQRRYLPDTVFLDPDCRPNLKKEDETFAINPGKQSRAVLRLWQQPQPFHIDG